MGEKSLARQDALDGVRALALVLVLCFHAGFEWMSGGYVGVSVFFTLSGYLITNLLLTEHAATGRVGLGAFYSRRWKRLLPASLLCLLGIVALRYAGAFGEVGRLRGDLVAAILQVFNWRELAGGSSYAALFTGGEQPSPVAHFWSLAIEEQFYLFWPVVLVGIVAVARRWSMSVLALVAALTVVFAVSAPIIAWRFGPDAAYWSTPSRLAEILIGACVACVLRTPAIRERAGRGGPLASAVAPLALVGIVVAAMVLPSNDGPAFQGLMPVFAIMSAAFVVGLQTPGPVTRLLSWRPFVWLGLISYGAYLFHWPVFVVLTERGWVLSEPLGFGLAIVITVGLAVLSYRFVEQPIRIRTWSIPRMAGAASLSTALALVVVVVALPATRGRFTPNRQVLAAAAIVPTDVAEPLVPATTSAPQRQATDAERDVVVQSPSPTTVPPTTVRAVTSGIVDLPEAPNRPVKILVVGDSTAYYVGNGLAWWAVDHPAHAQVDLLWSPGFGLITTGTITSWDAASSVERSAEIIAEDLPDTVRRVQPDVVVLMITMDDVLNRTWNDTEGVLTTADPRYRQRMTDAYRATTAELLQSGVPSVVWVLPPRPAGIVEALELLDGNRYDVQSDVIQAVADEFTPATTVVDLHRWMLDTGLDRDESFRPDGVHMTDESAHGLADAMLGASLVNIAVSPR